MKIVQISITQGRKCGISLFASNLQTYLRDFGIDIVTAATLARYSRADIVLLQYHEELMSDTEVIVFANSCPAPVIIFAHSECCDDLHEHVDGIITMCPGMIRSTNKPIFSFPHPAWTPQQLEDRNSLRREFDLPEDRLVVGTNGFLKFERQFIEIIEVMLPEACRNDWFIELITSPWRLDSPGLITKLEKMRVENPHNFRFEHNFLDTVTLNRRLQACDLLWCWTQAPSSPYASGVISDQYASGTRVIAADKLQHRHILGLPNTVAGPDSLAPFIDCLLLESHKNVHKRHDPMPVSWGNFIHGLTAFLKKLLS